VLYWVGTWSALDANDALRAEIWNGSNWEDISADLLTDGVFTPLGVPWTYLDTGGNIRVRFHDSAVVKREKKDTVTVDLLYAHVSPVDEPPAPPTGLAATGGVFQVNLNWNDSIEYDLAGYNVWRRTASEQFYIKINPGLVQSSEYVDTQVQAGVTYYYVVTAVDAAGLESGASTEASARPYAEPPLSVHVQEIAMAIQRIGSSWQATATVLVHNQDQAAQPGVSVRGDWYLKGALIQTGASATCDATGRAVLTSPLKRAKTGDLFTFKVTGLVLAGYQYDPSQNVETQDSVAVP
jgi:hypothetical protein